MFETKTNNKQRGAIMELSYTNVERFIKPFLTYLHIYQLSNVILCVYGIIHAQSLEYAQIARNVPTKTNHNHTKKRIYRFINNDNIDLCLLMVYWCRFIVGLLYGLRKYVPVIVDITWVNGHKYLVATIPFVFRAIPIAFTRFTDAEVRMTSQNQIENDFFSWLRMTLWKYKVVIIADRGFKRASLMQFLRDLGLHYVIRVCGNVWVTTNKESREQYSGILGDIVLKSGEKKYLYKALYHKELHVETNLILGKLKSEQTKKGKKLEPWYIATDIKNLELAYQLYKRRMWIEEMFRDWKSRFHWTSYKVKTPIRMEKMTMCLMISYTIVVLLGNQVEKSGKVSQVSSYGKSSVTYLGISILKHKTESSSSLFRKVRRHYDLVSDKLAA